MNVSDYIVGFIVNKNVKHIFGYQGTMISYFVDAICRNTKIENHSCYNEQGAAFAACGYAQASESCAVAYATSGPGAVNLLSGVANAYCDSIPVVFITGQINTYEYANIKGLRQQGFQEIDIVSMVKPITKYAVHVNDAEQACYEFEKAWHIANSGRKGSVLIDIPMNIQREVLNESKIKHYVPKSEKFTRVNTTVLFKNALNRSKRPVFLIGNGVSQSGKTKIVDYAERFRIPIITSLLQKNLLPDDNKLNFGFIGGAYGMRVANLIAAAKADLLVCIGISLCTRQIGTKVERFAPSATILRVDCDPNVLKRKINQEEIAVCMDSDDFIDSIVNVIPNINYENWLEIADGFRKYLKDFDRLTPERHPNRIVEKISEMIPEKTVVACDVGQHMMWVAQSFLTKVGQKILFSGGHGAMGFALPAAIGASYYTGKSTYCFAGDGAFQMNIQELQWVVRENLPIKIIVLNNNSLGMIRFLQKDYFEDRYEGTSKGHHYEACNFSEVAKAYGIDSAVIEDIAQISNYKQQFYAEGPFLLEVRLSNDTFAFPKTFLGEEIYNQRPYIPESVLKKFLSL